MSASFFKIVCTTASFSIVSNTLSRSGSSFSMFYREVAEVRISKIVSPSRVQCEETIDTVDTVAVTTFQILYNTIFCG